MSARVHPTAIVDPGADLGRVEVGPYAIVGAGVRVGDGTTIGAHAVLAGPGTTIGRDNRIFPFASVGHDPQDLKYRGEPTDLVIGDGNTVREFVTLHRGTSPEVGGTGRTEIGDRCTFMAYSHVAHDCRVGSRCVFANSVALAGHVTVEDGAILGGLCAVHQHTRVGRLAFVGGGAMATMDVPPYCRASGDRAKLYGLNTIGLRRAGLSDDTIRRVKAAYRILFQSGDTLSEAVARIEADNGDCAEVTHLLQFVRTSTRGVCR